MTTSEYNQTAMLTTRQTAKVVGLTAGTLMNWRHAQRKGQPPYHKAGKAVRYQYGELLEWLKGNLVERR